MKVIFFSDVHIEIRESESRVPWTETYPLDLGPDLTAHAGTVDLAVLAGDIGTVRPLRGVSTLGYARQVSEFLGCPVVLVPGNHEFYGGNFDDDRDALLSAQTPEVTVLDRGECFLEGSSGRLRILGATLWTDYSVAGDQMLSMLEARRWINDHRRIRRRGGAFFGPEDALAEHVLSRAWLAGKLAEPHTGFTLVVTHHVPHSAARHPAFPVDLLSGAFYSDCTDLITAAAEARVVAWIFGHHHWCMEIEVGGVRLVSAQPGYPRDQTGWGGPGVLNIAD